MDKNKLLKYLEGRKCELENKLIIVKNNEYYSDSISHKEQLACLLGSISMIEIIINDIDIFD